MASLEDLRAALHRDPRGVADAAGALVADARAADDAETLSRALAIRGRARRSLGDIDLADGDLREALSLGEAIAESTGNGDLAADAHVGLAGVLSFAGNAAEAFDHLDAADTVGSEQTCAYSSLQRAIIHQRLGHMDEALAGYGAALPTLRELDARTDLALVLMNRGVIRTQAGDYDGAVADLSESQHLFRDGGNDFGVAQTMHGLGWAHSRSGDLPRAMGHLEDAAAAFHELGHEGPEVDVDRIETLLAAGLAEQASELAIATARRLTAAGNRTQAAEVWLLVARAALLADDPAQAASYADRARAAFARAGSTGWERAARLELVRSDTAADPDALVALSRELDDAGNARGAVTALGLAAVAAVRAGDAATATTLAADARRRSKRLGIVEVALLAARASATAAAERGDRASATRFVRAGLRALDRSRAALLAVDARAAIGGHARELAAVGLRLAAQTGSPAALFAATELARAGRAYDTAPARPPTDAAAAARLAELRGVAAEAREREAAGEHIGDVLDRLRDLEQQVHNRDLRTSVDGTADEPVVPTVTELAAILDGRVLVSMTAVDGDLIAVRVGGGRTKRVDLGPMADMVSAGVALSRLLRAAVLRPSPGRLATVRRAATAVGDRVAPALTGDCGVVLVVPAALHALPWQLLPALHGRAVAVAPSATWWCAAHAADGAAARPGIAVAGPRLVYAEQEARTVAACHRGSTALTGESATVASTVAAFRDAAFVHVAAHSRIRHDNPLWTSLELADGPLYVYDLEQTARTPARVVLSGCETGVGVRAGDELLGLSNTFLHRGTTELVASVCPLPDSAATCVTMARLHAAMAAGFSAAQATADLTADSGSGDSDAIAAHLVAASLLTYGRERGS